MDSQRTGKDLLLDEALEMAFANVINHVKHALDAHLEVYNKVDGVRSTPYDEAISISATARTAYEASAQVVQMLTTYNIPISRLREKHKLCLRLCRKLINDTHHNNVIVDHPRADPVACGIGLARFLEALHVVLTETTDEALRYQHAKKFLLYNQERHDDDPNLEARVPSFAEETSALLQQARA